MPFHFAGLYISVPDISMTNDQIISLIVECQKCRPEYEIRKENNIPEIINDQPSNWDMVIF